MREARALFQKLSAGERTRYQEAQQAKSTELAFDPDTRLSAEEQAYFLNSLVAMHAPAAAPAPKSVHRPAAAKATERRALTPLELARIRRRVLEVVPVGEGGEIARQVAWSIEAGALARFGALHGLNIALKKLREGAWARPHRMPPNWRCALAGPESCSGA